MQNGKDDTQAVDSPETAPSNTAFATPVSMRDELTVADIGNDHLGLDKVEPPASPSCKQWVSFGLFILISVAMIATGLVVTVASEKKTSTVAAEQARLEESVKGRGQVLSTWVESRIQISRRLTESGLVRLFVSDLALNPVGHLLPRPLLDQRPYFQTLMADFAKQNDLVRAAIIDEHGRLLLSSSGPPLDIDTVLASVSKASVGWKSMVLPIRVDGGNGNRLVVDILVPLPRAQVTNEISTNDAAILIQTLAVDSLLNSLLRVSPQRKGTEKVYIVQERAGAFELISLETTGLEAVSPLRNEGRFSGQEFEFGRWSIAEGQSHYSLGEPVLGGRWTIVHSVEAQAVLASVNDFIVIATGIAFTIVLVLSCCFAAVWWHRASAHHRDLISIYQSFAERINKQRRFLVAVTSSITDWLAVSDREGQCIYVNRALTTALGLADTEILGRHRTDVFPLRSFPQKDDVLDSLMSGEPINVLDINGRPHFIATSSSDLRGHDGQSIGTVMVMRDQTELVEQRQQRIRALTETISAFVHVIERRDPFLLGHTYRLRRYAIAVGRKLRLDDDGLVGLALAASLSQIGKIFIPNAILIKPKRHNQQETEIMRGHIDHAVGVLGHIDFGFPVVEILSQMHERLDGSGYPKGSMDVDIDVPGRILGAVDVFCARTAPRSYRDRLSAGNALFHLANNVDRYDLQVIAALAEVVAKDGLLDPADEIDAGFLDAEIWKNVQHSQNSELGAAA